MAPYFAILFFTDNIPLEVFGCKGGEGDKSVGVSGGGGGGGGV